LNFTDTTKVKLTSYVSARLESLKDFVKAIDVVTFRKNFNKHVNIVVNCRAQLKVSFFIMFVDFIKMTHAKN